VLIVEAGQDGVVATISRLLLRQSLPLAERWLIETAGHSLLGADPVWSRSSIAGEA